jgi:hypothetical protein
MQINPDGTKTMETGGKKMIYQWNDDLNIVTQQTEESKRAGEVLENLKLGCVFCITIPCRLTLDLGIDVSINVIFL